MRVPTTENCPTCANETPKEHLAKFGRVQSKVYQDLDTGKYSCVKGHEVNLAGQVEEPAREDLAKLEFIAPVVDNFTTDPAALEAVNDYTSVAVAEELPQSYQSQIAPGSLERRQGGALALTMLVPEQYAEPLLEYCRGIGKEPEEYINEVIQNAFENGWFL